MGPGACIVVQQCAFGRQAGDQNGLQCVCRRAGVRVSEAEIGSCKYLVGVFINADAAIRTRGNLVVQDRGRELPWVAGDAIYTTNVTVDAVGLGGGQQHHADL